MSERLYCLRPDPAVFDAGTARGKQVLLSNDVNEISLYWFAPDGTFLELELIPIEPATLPPGSRKWSDGKVVAEGLNWNQRVERQLADLKDKLGFVQGEIHVRKLSPTRAPFLICRANTWSSWTTPRNTPRTTERRSRDTFRSGVGPRISCWISGSSIG